MRAFAHDPAAADLQRHAYFRHRHADPFAARKAHRRRRIIDCDAGRDHVDKVGLVPRRHDDEARQATEIGDVERAGMGLAVLPDEAGAVDRKAHRQFLDRDIVHDLVVGALQEGRVDRRERLHTLGREAGGEGHRVLLGDADIEAALGKPIAEEVEPGARRHRRGDRDDPLVFLGFLDQRFGEHGGVCGAFGVDFACAPVITSNLATLCHLSSACSADR